jgi:GNAT superfamily N-acetyltransferase
VRTIEPASAQEIELVARRMRETLVEVLGEERGVALYTMEWLRERVRWHLDPAASTAAVFVSEDPTGHVTGHTIVRIEREPDGTELGLFSTTFVEPAARRLGIATMLLLRGEEWIREQGMTISATCTSATNTRLIALYVAHGYRIDVEEGEMIRLAKRLAP